MNPTQSNSNKKVKRLPVFDDSYQLEKFLTENFTQSLKQMIKVIIKKAVKEEMDLFRKEFEEKFSQRLYFNGTYDRNLLSSWGKIEDVPIPRFRNSFQDLNFSPLSLNVFNNEREKFERLIEKMHLLGISQRKIRYLFKVCFGINISKNRVGRIYKELAEEEEFQINAQPIADDYQYLFFDGVWEKTKGYGWIDNKSVLLCCLGLKENGEKKILGFSLQREEDEQSWEKFIKKIKERGLAGKNLKLIITDDNPAFKKVVNKYFPTLPIQTCIVHKIRNVIFKTKYQNRKQIASDLKTIFQSQTKQEAIEKTKKVIRKWYLAEGKAISSLRFNIEYCFTYFSFPKELWSRIRTNNILEREFRELRRRWKVFDNTFQSEESANRYANSIISYLNQNYPLNDKLHTKS